MSEQQVVTTEGLLSKVPNRFVLSIGASRRGRQIQDGATLLVPNAHREQPVLAALKEIQADKIKIEMKREE
ncbi:MAG: DNA-directed RNA polymerase subunit omega [Candidatus Margulisiibacteriota bacterium]|jgi:DNA-directed RNA polymerase subunit omega